MDEAAEKGMTLREAVRSCLGGSGATAGGASSMTALAAYWPATGRLETHAAQPAFPPLAEREHKDSVAPNTYAAIVREGTLPVLPGRVTPLADFLRQCADRLLGADIASIGADR